VRISPKASEPSTGANAPGRSPSPAKQGRGKRADLKSLLDTNGLMLLLLCLAWSEETISPTTDASYQFIHRMREAAEFTDDDGMVSDVSVSDEMKARVKHLKFAKIHSWVPAADGVAVEDERPEEDAEEDGYEEEEEEEELEEDRVDDGAGVGRDYS